MIIHIGIRPTFPLKVMSIRRTYFEGIACCEKKYFETYPKGGGRHWTERELKSGCGQEIETIKEENGLIYCPHCDEWFSTNQFEKVEK